MRTLILLLLLTSCAGAQAVRTLQSTNGKTAKDSVAAQLASNQKETIPIGVNGAQYMLTLPVSSTQQSTTGAIPYWGNAALNNVFQLAIGTSGFALTSNGSVPVWTDPTLVIPAHAVINNPDATTWNTHNLIIASDDVAPLSLQSVTGATADLFDLSWIGTGGGISAWFAAHGNLTIFPHGADVTPLSLKNKTGGSADILKANSQTIIDANGSLYAPGGQVYAGQSSVAGSVQIFDGAAHKASLIASSAMAFSWTWALPSADGTIGQVMETDGSGNLGWVTLPSSGMSNPMTTTGDIIYSSDNLGTPARLGRGASTTVLHGGTTPSYSQIVNGDITNATINLTTKITGVLPEANGGTNQSTYATGDLLYASATNTLSKRAIGSTGNVLTVASGIPVWAAPASSSTTAQTIEIDNILTTPTAALTLQNTTAATSSTNQYSPGLWLQTTGWKTNATAASQNVYGTIELRPRTNSVSPDAEMVFSLMSNTTTPDTVMTLWRDYNGSSPQLTLGSAGQTGAIIKASPRTSASDGGDFYVQSADGNGLNHFGGNLYLTTGRTTGNKLGSAIKFQSNAAGASGSTLNSLFTIGQIAPTSSTAATLDIGVASAVTGTLRIDNSATSFQTSLIATQPTAARTITFPDATGTVALTNGGTATLSGGTVTVSDGSVTASSLIVVSATTFSNPGAYFITAITAGTSFVIKSTNIADASTVQYTIFH